MLEELDLHTPSLPLDIPQTTHFTGSLKQLDLDGELYSTYMSAKLFLAGVKDDESIPPNQVAQVFNTISAILKEITKMQTDVYNAERVKKQELAMIHALKHTTEEVQDAFFAEFEKLCSAP